MIDEIRNEYEPDYVTPPGKTLKDALDALRMDQAELARRIGMTPKTIGAIIKHGAPITPETALNLEKALGVPASFWNNRESRYRQFVARQQERERLKEGVSWLRKFPVRIMVKLGWIKKYADPVDQLEELLSFFGVASPDDWKKVWLEPEAVYRRSSAFECKPEANSVWLRKGEIEANRITCRPFDEARFRRSLKTIRKLTTLGAEGFGPKVVDSCAASGVAVVFVPPIKGAPLFGATRWLTPQKALIQLSLRGKFEDLFWFTFFHEAGHILYHGKTDVFLECHGTEGKKEEQANRFARDFLIPAKDYGEFVRRDPQPKIRAIKEFAGNLGISVGIVVGRLRHDKRVPWKSPLTSVKQRFQFDDE
jgi:addiction module HigA family antidote